MLKRLFFKFGAFGSTDHLGFEPSTMTVFVGPNNSGKSLVLQELGEYLENGPQAGRQIVEGVAIAIPSNADVENLLHARESYDQSTPAIREGCIRVVRPNPSTGTSGYMDVNVANLQTQISAARSQKDHGHEDWWRKCWPGIFAQLISLYSVVLDGRTRLALTDQRPAGDLLSTPANHLSALFQDDELRLRVRRIVREAFEVFFVIDPTNPPNLRIRMASRAPEDNQEEQSLDQRARSYHSEALPIDQFSDGVRAFTGLISALVSADYKIMLVDEPEAFLHPPLAGQLGREMATLADERLGNVLASTHSSRFLMGCVESGKPLNIVRLTYTSRQATARLLPSQRIQELMRDPLLRSTGVLEALFCHTVVVCEGDVDRAFYAEINNRLQAADRPYLPDALCLNGQNKQTVRRIVAPLRDMGIPAAAIVDIDIIRKKGDLRELLKACLVPDEIIKSLGQLRAEIESQFQKRNLEMKKGGISLLEGQVNESCQSLFDQLAAYGIFVVPGGEVESWLDYLGVRASKSNWLPAIFERMKADPNDSDYVWPQDGDVWQFVERISSWVQNGNRRGMPLPLS